jgi:arsenate reductase (thioredoxin)
MIFHILDSLINNLKVETITEDRKKELEPLVQYITAKKLTYNSIRLNFICTHNSRRSHLSQIWAQTMAYYFNISDVHCYSGGTEATAIYYKVVETLVTQGFESIKLSDGENPVIAFKFSSGENPNICFSKPYNHTYNPSKGFAAILTCNAADEKCPIVHGADLRIAIKYVDPKIADGTTEMDATYAATSLLIATEMHYIFGQVAKKLT